MDTLQVLAIAPVFLLAGAVKGVTGMGLPTVAMSLLGLWMLPTQAAALLVAPSLATNVAQCRGPHLRQLARRLWPGWVTIVIVTVIAPGFEDAESARAAKLWLGVILIAYGLLGLWRPSLPDLSARGAWMSAVAGAATGAVTAFTAVFVLPWVPYLQTQRLDKDALVQALGLSFTFATLALAVRAHTAMAPGWWSMSTTLAVCIALAGAFCGLKLGELARGRLAGPAFQRALFILFVGLGTANLVKAV